MSRWPSAAICVSLSLADFSEMSSAAATCCNCARNWSTVWFSSAICARALSEYFCSSASCAAIAARCCSSVVAFAAASRTCFSRSSRNAVSARTWSDSFARSDSRASIVALSTVTVLSISAICCFIDASCACAAASCFCASASCAVTVAFCWPAVSAFPVTSASCDCKAAARPVADCAWASASDNCADRWSRSAFNASRSAVTCAVVACNARSCPARSSRAALAAERSCVKLATEACKSCVRPRSSESMSVISAICRFSRSSARSRPDNATDKNACPNTNTNRTKMITINNVDSASTYPGHASSPLPPLRRALNAMVLRLRVGRGSAPNPARGRCPLDPR